MRPARSYTIWFSQRTASSLLCKALEGTGIAGKPGEWLYAPYAKDFLPYYGVKSHAELREKLWSLGSTANGVCGLKFSFHEPYFSRILELLRGIPGCPTAECVNDLRQLF